VQSHALRAEDGSRSARPTFSGNLLACGSSPASSSILYGFVYGWRGLLINSMSQEKLKVLLIEHDPGFARRWGKCWVKHGTFRPI